MEQGVKSLLLFYYFLENDALSGGSSNNYEFITSDNVSKSLTFSKTSSSYEYIDFCTITCSTSHDFYLVNSLSYSNSLGKTSFTDSSSETRNYAENQNFDAGAIVRSGGEELYIRYSNPNSSELPIINAYLSATTTSFKIRLECRQEKGTYSLNIGATILGL